MFSPSYLQNNRQRVFDFPLNYAEKNELGVGQIHAGNLQVHFRIEGESYKLIGLYYGGVNVAPLLAYMERQSGTPLFPQIQYAIENHIRFLSGQPEPVTDDHTLNNQNFEPCLNS